MRLLRIERSGFEPWPGTLCLCSRASFTWVSANLMLGVKILLVASRYRNQDKLWPDEPVGLHADLTLWHNRA